MNTPHPIFPIMTPLRALWRWLMAEPGQPVQHRDGPRSPASAPTLRSQVLKASVSTCSISRPALRPPVRVLRVMEAGQAPTHVGRMRISGCMADVCAELDRLAARESLLH